MILPFFSSASLTTKQRQDEVPQAFPGRRKKENKTFGGSVLVSLSLRGSGILINGSKSFDTSYFGKKSFVDLYTTTKTRTRTYDSVIFKLFLSLVRFARRWLFNKFSILTDCEWNKVVRQSSVVVGVVVVGALWCMFIWWDICILGIYGGWGVRVVVVIHRTASVLVSVILCYYYDCCYCIIELFGPRHLGDHGYTVGLGKWKWVCWELLYLEIL